MRKNTRSNRVPSLLSSAAGLNLSWVSRLTLPCALAAAVLLAAGCSSRSLNTAPVEDRGTGQSSQVTSGYDPSIKPLPGIENAGKPGYYTVRPGDTMIRIGLETGRNWHDIARWNKLENPNLIEVGQVVRVIPPVNDASTQVVTRPVSSGSTASATRPVASDSTPSSGNGDEDVGWIWPAQGSLVAGFDEAKNKGLDISGKAGDAVMASADGKVVYAGAGLRGYGNLIILKHNNTFLTAYAHNRALLVKEDQSVKKGQKIAEMGNSDADRVKLHFEIRRQGKPVDPAKYLPAR